MSSLLPANVMRMLGPAAKQSNEEVLISYMISQEGSVQLTEPQKELLTRLNHADDLMRDGKHRSKHIALLLSKKYEVSSATAYRYIESARTVFGNSRKTNKNYLLALHIDRIQDAITLATTTGNLSILPKLLDNYTNAVKLLPEETGKNIRPTAILFNITQNNITVDITADEAQETAMQLLKEKGVDIEFLEDDHI